MKSHVFIDNIKCGGCANTISKKIKEIPSVSNVEINIDTGQVTFNCENDACRLEVLSTLARWGYPLSGTGSRLDSAKSYISCMIGKFDKSQIN